MPYKDRVLLNMLPKQMRKAQIFKVLSEDTGFQEAAQQPPQG